jgi:hypothetical protein
MAKDLNDHTIILFPMLLVQMDSVVVNHVLFIRIFFISVKINVLFGPFGYCCDDLLFVMWRLLQSEFYRSFWDVFFDIRYMVKLFQIDACMGGLCTFFCWIERLAYEFFATEKSLGGHTYYICFTSTKAENI